MSICGEEREAFTKMAVPTDEDVQMTDAPAAAGAPDAPAAEGAVPLPSKTAKGKGKGKATDGMVLENEDEDLLPWSALICLPAEVRKLTMFRLWIAWHAGLRSTDQ